MSVKTHRVQHHILVKQPWLTLIQPLQVIMIAWVVSLLIILNEKSVIRDKDMFMFSMPMRASSSHF